MTSHHRTDRNRKDLVACLGDIDDALKDVMDARPARPVDEAGCPPEALPLARTVNRMIRFMHEIAAFILPLSHGELSAPRPAADNVMARPLTEMHARLTRLTRQTQEIARGDYSQRIDFMGEFSEAFNAMVALLEERERSLKDEIVNRQRAEADLQGERDLLVGGPVVTFRWDVSDEGEVEYVSPNISLYGYRPEEFMSGRRTYASIVDPADYEWIVEDGNDKSHSGLESWTQEYRITDVAGETHWVRDYTHAVRGEDGAVTAYEGYIIDITTQKAEETALRQREEQLRMLSLSDNLTGLYNRRGLLALGEHAMRSARRRGGHLAVIYVDVDGLRSVNDRFGHAQGDEALRTIADVLRTAIPEADLAGRVGGDEFVVLVDDEPEVTGKLAARLRRRLQRADEMSGRPFRISSSIGLADWDPAEPLTFQELIERADERMHDEKRAKRQQQAARETGGR